MQIRKNPDWKTTLFAQKCVPKTQDLLHIDNPLFSVAGTGQTKARESLVYSQNTRASLLPRDGPVPSRLRHREPCGASPRALLDEEALCIYRFPLFTYFRSVTRSLLAQGEIKSSTGINCSLPQEARVTARRGTYVQFIKPRPGSAAEDDKPTQPSPGSPARVPREANLLLTDLLRQEALL